jgi:ribosome-associated protein
MRKAANICDFFVIASASSQRRAQAISELIEETFKEKGIRLRAGEGRREGMWILLDFADVVVHIFFKEVRDYYGLERLWADAKRVNVRRTRTKTAGASSEER